ncbi:MAG: NAD(+) kinase [Gammaproteobacteria bacterium]|nr:NAD(+) kinase [Gammaproteobacteria bacterium]MCI0591367.1 NAD(+) kinase [Gammaproteobacteria bacterium]
MQKFKRVGLIAKGGAIEIRGTLRSLMEFLKSRGLAIVTDAACADLLPKSQVEIVERRVLGGTCDLAIAIGGDGTMLNAARLLSDHDVPLLGINLGRLGFLADLSPDAINETLARILNGEFVEDRRFLLHSQVVRDGQAVMEGDALNDVVIHKQNVARLVEFETYINNTFVYSQRSDGMIVSTPTGSTAYALSGGGPLLNPDLDAIVLVPICPHTISNRPIVVDGGSRIEIVVGTREIDHARLTCDGEIAEQLLPGDHILIFKKTKQIRLIHPAGHDHYAILRAKLQWGRELC